MGHLLLGSYLKPHPHDILPINLLTFQSRSGLRPELFCERTRMSESPQLTPPPYTPYFCLFFNCPKLRRDRKRSNMCGAGGTICGHCFKKKTSLGLVRHQRWDLLRILSQVCSIWNLKQRHGCVCVCGQRWDEVCTRRKVTRIGFNTVNFPLSFALWLCNNFWVRTEIESWV